MSEIYFTDGSESEQAKEIAALKAELKDWENDCNEDQQYIARLKEENARLREALEGVIVVADRKTKEFDAARAALGRTD